MLTAVGNVCPATGVTCAPALHGALPAIGVTTSMSTTGVRISFDGFARTGVALGSHTICGAGECVTSSTGGLACSPSAERRTTAAGAAARALLHAAFAGEIAGEALGDGCSDEAKA